MDKYNPSSTASQTIATVATTSRKWSHVIPPAFILRFSVYKDEAPLLVIIPCSPRRCQTSQTRIFPNRNPQITASFEPLFPYL